MLAVRDGLLSPASPAVAGPRQSMPNDLPHARQTNYLMRTPRSFAR